MEISASAFSSGLSALQSGQRRVEQAATDIASSAVVPAPPQNQVAGVSPSRDDFRPDLTESLVALRVAENEAKTGAKLVKTADEVLGTLIDITA